MEEILTASFIVGLLRATVRMATPLILGSLGEVFIERAGVLNLGIEGTMILGALAGFLVVYFSGSLWLGVLAALITGALLGLLMAFLAVSLGLSQHVSGLGITIFATGLAYFIYRMVIGSPTVPPTVTAFETAHLPLLSDIPIVGPILFQQYALTYLAFLLVPLSSWLLFRTTLGLQMRAVGENPEAADTVGVNVYRTRYLALVIGGALMGMAGSFFTLIQMNMFLIYGVVTGRGWVCIALVIFGNWIPARVLAGALLFGGVEALQLRLQTIGLNVPSQFFNMLPYLLTIVALIGVARNASYPAALLKPYKRE